MRSFKFSWWGVLGALIWVFNGLAAIAAVQKAGIGVSQATWSALTIVVSFLWGSLYYREVSGAVARLLLRSRFFRERSARFLMRLTHASHSIRPTRRFCLTWASPLPAWP